MSDPRVNTETQSKRHAGPLIGILVGLAVVALLAFFFLGNDTEEMTDEATTTTINSGDTVLPADETTVVPTGTTTEVPVEEEGVLEVDGAATMPTDDVAPVVDEAATAPVEGDASNTEIMTVPLNEPTTVPTVKN